MLLLGLDVGTTSSKAVVMDVDGSEVGHGRSATRWAVNEAGTDTAAQAVLESARLAIAEALAQADARPGQVAGVGIASMGEAGVLIDGRGEPVAPVIAWHDGRDHLEVTDLAAVLGGQAFAGRTGLPLRSQWSLTKHRWLLQHHDGAGSAVRRLSIAEWIVRAFGGEEASEQSLASRTGWLDLGSRDWWPEAVEWSGASTSLLPPLVTAGTALGAVTTEADIAVLTGATLTVAGHDHQAAAVGVHAAGSGDVLDSCGTAEALIRTVPSGLGETSILALTNAGITVGWHVLAGHWCLLGGTQGGLVLQRTLAALGKSGADLAALDRDALAAEPAAVRITGDDHVTIHGITEGTGPARIWRAALEEVTARADHIHQAMTSVSGAHDSFVVTGGWARSDALLDFNRRSFGPLSHPAVGEAGARGAALLAGVAAGVYRDLQDASSRTEGNQSRKEHPGETLSSADRPTLQNQPGRSTPGER
jgi:sugar (pentulose or hexulose) kinase